MEALPVNVYLVPATTVNISYEACNMTGVVLFRAGKMVARVACMLWCMQQARHPMHAHVAAVVPSCNPALASIMQFVVRGKVGPPRVSPSLTGNVTGWASVLFFWSCRVVPASTPPGMCAMRSNSSD